MKKRNKKYNPQKRMALSGVNVIKTKNNINREKLADLEIHALNLIDKAKRGEMTVNDFNDALHITASSAAFAKMGIGVEAMDYAEASNTSLKFVYDRYLRSGRIGFSGDELKAFTQLIECYYWQLQNSTLLQAANAIQAAHEFLIAMESGR